ncbi:MAG: LCP family protein [Anaerolineae bacterium]|jgi:LCP family protein required for cell wall assembly
MKPTEIRPVEQVKASGALRPDRLTPLLIAVAVILVAILILLASDLWFRPISGGGVAQAVGAAELAPTSAAAGMEPAIGDAVSAVSGDLASPAPAITPPACVPPSDWGIYLVEQGNTLFSLARRYGTDVETLMHVNCLNANTIFVGQRLYVPGMAAPASSDGAPLPAGTPQPGTTADPAPANAVAALPTLTPMPAIQVSIPDRYTNIVLLGSDRRPGSAAWRTDSIIIVSVDSANKIVRLLSIPRDLWVYIPGHGYNRINTADLWGELAKEGSGPERVKQTIHHNLGIPIHYYVRIDFEGFKKIIDAVGGIDVDVDCALTDIKLSAGMHHMDGKLALRYARSRYSTNDFDRGRRQRKVLLALWDQALTMDIIPKLPQLWWTMATSFQTDLTLDQVINLAYVGTQLEPQRILSRAIGASHVQSWMTPQGAAVLLPQQDKIRALLDAYYTPVDPNNLDGASKLQVEVLNGSQRNDADQLAVANLRWAGFKAKAAGPAESQNYNKTQIFIYTGNTGAAHEIAQELQVPASNIQDLTGTQAQPDPANSVDFQVILGWDYDPCQR